MRQDWKESINPGDMWWSMDWWKNHRGGVTHAAMGALSLKTKNQKG